MLHVHVDVACPYQCFTSCPCSCCKSTSMLHVHVNATCPCLYAAGPRCVHAAYPCCVYAACLCWMSMLYVHAACPPCFMSLLHVHAVYLCCMYLLLVDAACIWCMSSENFGPESDSRICAKMLGRDFLVNPSWNWLGFRLEIVLIEIKNWFRFRLDPGSDWGRKWFWFRVGPGFD